MNAQRNVLLFVVIALILLGAGLVWMEGGGRSRDGERGLPGAELSGMKILWVNSYHPGYAWSDGEFDGARERLRGTGVELKQIFMDTKLNDSEEFGITAGKKAKEEIDAFSPDLIIAADDPAQKYLIVPYYRKGTTPVIFCGVNWDASEYNYPASHITGIIEVELAENLLGYLREHAKGSRVAYVAGNDLSERRISRYYNRAFFDGKMQEFLPQENTFASYRQAFLEAQKSADIVILGGAASIVDWDDAEAERFFRENTVKPTGTANSWMVNHALIAYTRVAEEQGQWAADAALRILSGTPPREIPIARNKIGRLYINLDIAEKMNVVFSPALLKNASTSRQE